MINVLKYLLKTSLVLIAISIVLLVGIVTLLDPNQFKDSIQKQIAEHSGRTLHLHGPLSWKLYPALAVEAQDLSLSNAPGFSPEFLKLKILRLSPKLWTLLSGKLLLDIQAEGLTLHLSRNTHGHNNWQDIVEKITHSDKPSFYARFIAPYSIRISDASLHWEDTLQHQMLHCTQISASAPQLALGFTGTPSPISFSMQLKDLNTTHSGHFSLQANWHFNRKLQHFDIQELQFNSNFPDLPFTTLLATLQIQKTDPTPTIQGTLQIPNLNVQTWLENFSLPFNPLGAGPLVLNTTFRYQSSLLEVSSFTLALENSGIISGSFKSTLPEKIQTLALQGTFEGKNLRLGIIPIPELKTNLDIKEGVFDFSQITAQWANSQHRATLQIDLRGHLPNISFYDQMDSFDINEFLTCFGDSEKDKIYGKIHAKTSLTTKGNTLQDWLQNLSGKSFVQLSDGKLRGINLSPLLQHAQATMATLTDSLSKKHPLNVGAILTAELGEWKQQAIHYQQLTTPFRLLETNITFDNGKAYTSDCKITHPEYTVHGHGVIDFMQQNIEYQALALLHHARPHPAQNFALFLKETPLAILIKGPLNDFSVQPDLVHYAEGALKGIQKESLEKTTDHTLEKLFGFP